MIKEHELDFKIDTKISLHEWPEWVRHNIVVRLDISDDPKVVGPVVAKARVCRCVVPYDEGSKDTWDETQDLWDFHTEALTAKVIKEEDIELALCANVSYIENIEVIKEYRRKGVASHVMRVILDYLVDPQGIVGLTLPKGKDKQWLKKFYERFGFFEAGKTSHMLKDSTKITLLEKEAK
ncbi:MAG TPA: GNAT family N-acetyltransferase [Verrucomicrobiae bacterium]|nr:GNAT family N-acetyltransferase [Verrucomicrobiae bacterium]